MKIPELNSIKSIERQYETGERPVLVTCSDKNAYICKYMRSSASAYKLASEFIGANMISYWNIRSPKFAFVKIEPAHWANINTSHSSAVALGYIMLEKVADINNVTIQNVKKNARILEQLLKIALFDFWIANEDRTYNNANLLYDLDKEELVSIDYGGIFNTSTYDYSLTQLTSTDTILYADIMRHLADGLDRSKILERAESLKGFLWESTDKCRENRNQIIDSIPVGWNIPKQNILKKVDELFESNWIDEVWNNFMECLNDNI